MHSTRGRTFAALQHSLRIPRVLVTVGVLMAGVVLAPAAVAAPQVRPAVPTSDGLLADPGDPTTADEAQTAWLEATGAAESMNEKVLVAIDVEHQARAEVESAARTVTAKEQALRTAKTRNAAAGTASAAAAKKLAVASAAEASYQDKVDEFADASFRGARFGSMSAMFTANSPEDFLETASTLELVADDTAQTLDRAAAAKATAAQARTGAQQAADSAAAAKSAADAAVTDAAAARTHAETALKASHAATDQVRSRQAKLKREADRLEALQNRLSEQERQAALAAQAAAARQAAQEAQARADRNRAAAAQQQAAAEQAAAEQAAAEQAAPKVADAPAGQNPSSAAAAPGSPAEAAPTEAAPTEVTATEVTATEVTATEAAPTEAAPTEVTATEAAPSAAAPTAAAPTAAAPSGAAEVAVQAALSKVGSPYVYGAAGPDSFDCSGFTSWAYAQAGITIPRTSGGQAGLQYVPLDQLRPGDLITYYSPVHHVAMYIGNGQIVHASTSSKPVYVTTMYYGGPNGTGHRVVG
ncbi:C40 family peptidase [Nakamurella sp. A5-74]|uniref:C40 family peptidase n=1 Tax=Nakamurella sp. A5-74 TaxID=3158264 RepID=A0AAU8DKA9_9ACTN